MQITGWQGEWGGSAWWARFLGFAAVVGALLGVAGPFGSFLNAGLAVRVMHWTGMTVLGALVTALVVTPAVRLGLRLRLPRTFSLCLGLVLSALPISVLSALITRLYWARQTATLGPADWFSQALMIEAAVVVVWLLFEAARSSRPRSSGPANTRPTAAPPTDTEARRREVLCLQMEDHYVRVRREGGSDLELMPFAQAISRYGGEGLQVHRSWWVASAAVAAAERDGRNWRLRLTDGTLVPVARNRVAAARAAGLIGEADEVPG